VNIIEVSKKENLGKKYEVFIDGYSKGVWELGWLYGKIEFDLFNGEKKALTFIFSISQILRMEFAEVIDWAKVKTDAQVLVSDDCENWVNRHFAKYDKEKDKFYTWKDGKTSFTTDLKEEWEYWDTID
jgi:hypothetical protein